MLHVTKIGFKNSLNVVTLNYHTFYKSLQNGGQIPQGVYKVIWWNVGRKYQNAYLRMSIYTHLYLIFYILSVVHHLMYAIY